MDLRTSLGLLSRWFRAPYSWLLRKRTILDSDRLYRAIHPSFIKDDGSISQGAFRDAEMSVDLASKTTVDRSWARFKSRGSGLASFAVCLARSLSQLVRHDPGPFNHAHTLVIGKKTQSIRRQFASNARWESRHRGERPL